jgi:cellulose synthase/poly-beta-1,6-N-acetylglucosamine synthase-like glycosyltransferase/spore germination protein YaaH/peptidoglycan/xylan/chitin deacetylase (PgdA/CDA1 family)
MSEQSPQIFQTNSATRWQRFKWGARILLVILILLISIVYITFKTAYQPDVPLEGRAMKKILSGDVPAYRQSDLSKRFRGFRKFIDNKWANGKGCGQKDSVLNLSSSALFSDSLGIRAAFYVEWDPQSFYSLKRNISKINLVLPEWFFIDPKADTLFTNINKRAFDVIKASGAKVVPLLSNNYNGTFNGSALHRILNNKAKQDRLIDDVLKLLTRFKFTGINVDFEELQEKRNENLTSFQKKLYQRLHAQGFMVTQNVSAFNEDYDYSQLVKYNDYLFLMAYDEYNQGSKAGPICSEKWVEAAVDKLAQHIPSKKIILNLAAYGYDWSKDTVSIVTYQQALSKARKSESIIDFDNNTYNLHFRYYDDKNNLHEIQFTDAATNFNSLRFSTEYGLAGTAVWRLGSEDVRLWDFYDKIMTKKNMKSFDFKKFSDVAGVNTPDYIGEGEILDILSPPQSGHISSEIDTAGMLISEETYDKLPSSYVIRKLGKTTQKKLVLTFEDGPDPKYTREILDTLAYYHTPAAFFLVGIQAEKNIPLVKRILREGHEIGNHSFTHPDISAVSTQRALLEMDATRLLIECITGRSTVLFRAPFNADSEPGKDVELIPVALSRTRNYLTVGESIDPEDWEKALRPDMNGDTILNRVINGYNERLNNGDSVSIILLHDAGGDRSATVNAVGKIIRYYTAKGYTFTTVADLLGKKRDDLMPPVPKGNGYYLLQINFILAETGYLLGHFFFALFLVFMILSFIRIIVIGVLAFKQKKKERNVAYTSFTPDNAPLVSIIVPAYNEEVNAVSSLQNLLKCSYPNFEIIFVDDGSKDATYEKVRDAFSTHPKMKIFTKKNGGKASALNYGIAQSHADYVVCIDADTKLNTDAVNMLMSQCIKKNVGAVAGVVTVGNEVNALTRWQSIEYITSQNFDRKGFGYVNAITVVPGAIGAFKKDALLLSGGFTTDTLAEDCDLTIRILKSGYIVANEPKAVSYTEAPESLKQFMKQRFRWSFGVMQVFWKHRDTLFNNSYKALAWIAMPDILLFKYIIPIFSPLADLLMILGLFTENRGIIGLYYLLFTLIDCSIAAISFLFEKENPTKLIWLIPQRLIYRWLMLIVLFRSFRRAIKGELQHWGVLKRTGNVKEEVVAIAN